MGDDKPMKSAYELAMERFQKKDAEAGIAWEPLTDAQKAAIAEVRTFYDAKLAELGILHQASLRKTFDPSEHASLEDDYRRERERLASQRDAKIEQARKGSE